MDQPTDAQQQPRASGYGQHVYLPDSRAGDDCAGCGQARADPTHVWPGASERGVVDLNYLRQTVKTVGYLLSSHCEQVFTELAALRTRLADAERKAKDWETAAGSIMVTNVELVGQMDAAQRKAQALRAVLESIAEWDYDHGRGLPVKLVNQLSQALASTDNSGRNI